LSENRDFFTQRTVFTSTYIVCTSVFTQPINDVQFNTSRTMASTASIDLLLQNAWSRVTGSRASQLRLTDLMTLFDVLENLGERKLLSNEYRDFLVEFILECPNTEVDIEQFKSLMERLFECPLNDVFRGRLYDRNVANESANVNRDSNISMRKGVDQGDVYGEDITQTMNLERGKFNSFLRNDSLDEREGILRDRIINLRDMISRSQDQRTVSKMKDVLINYYAKLDEITSSQVHIKAQAQATGVNATQSEERNALIERLKSNVDKQDVIINELRRKFGDDEASGILGFLKLKFTKLYLFWWRLIKFPVYILLGLMVLNIILVVFSGDYIDESIDVPSDSYWG
jgi:hypothetical protein